MDLTFDYTVIAISTFLLISILAWLRYKYKKSILYLGLFSLFYCYLMTVVAYTQFPIHFTSGAQFSPYTWNSINFIPLLTWTFTEFKMTYLNILMTMPFGFGLPLITRFRWQQVFIVGFLFSLVIEALQLLTILFTYRAVDVNDVIFNTLGVVIGYGVFLLFIITVQYYAPERWRDKLQRP